MSIASVSASIDSNQTLDGEKLSADVSDDTIAVANDEDILSANKNWYVNASAIYPGDGSQSRPYDNFFSVIYNSDLQDGDSIYFAGGENYIGDRMNVNLEIDKQLNLFKYGSGDAIFDAQGNSRVFRITASGINITGLTFVNGKDYFGSALYFENAISNSNINATFINNTAESDGGANYFSSAVTNSNILGTYINNTAEYFGGANYFDSTVINSTIAGTYINNAANYGGANHFIQSVTKSTISGTYNQNTATEYGESNYYRETVANTEITGLYTNNTANYGGANYFSSAVTNSNITGTYNQNTANTQETSTAGGGANNFDDTVTNTTISGTYTNNIANYGGANNFDDTVTNTTISGTYNQNTAEYFGGANHFENTVTNTNITGTYINNTANTNAIISFAGTTTKVNISNAIFLNNRYDVNKGVINAKNSGVVANNNWFGNNATNYQSKADIGENIQIDTWLFLNGTEKQDKVKFFLMNYNNTTDKTSNYDNTLLPIVNLTLSATNTTLAKNHALLNEEISHTPSTNAYITGQIENAKYTIHFGKGEFDLLQELIDEAEENSLINLEHNYTYNKFDTITTGVLINKNTTINGNGFTIDAKGKTRIFNVTAKSINITNITLQNGKADKGGAIYFTNPISNSNINATYRNNTANYGGANYFKNTVTETTIAGTYTNNGALSYGGANYFTNTVTNTNITGTYNNNYAGRGGANYFYQSVINTKITGTYINNTANNKGGANYFYQNVANTNITGTYINNTARNSAIIHFDGKLTDVSVSNAIFLRGKHITP